MVLHDHVGRTDTYQLNTEHPAAESIIALSRIAATFLNRLETHLEGWGDALRYAAVFESAATRRMNFDSDIDLLLVRASDPDDSSENADLVAWEQRVAELGRLVTAWTGNDGRVVEYTQDEIRAAAAAGEPLLSGVAGESLTIAGTRAWLNSRTKA